MTWMVGVELQPKEAGKGTAEKTSPNETTEGRPILNLTENVVVLRDSVVAAKVTHVTSQVTPAPVPALAPESPFPIGEDILLPLSQKLIFCGKQKDVAEIRAWLPQFDDDNRIEIACVLLKRLADKGYVSDGAREYAISKLVDGINAFRLELGSGTFSDLRCGILRIIPTPEGEAVPDLVGIKPGVCRPRISYSISHRRLANLAVQAC